MRAFTDHLWQSLLCAALAWALVRMTRGHSAQVHLWLWRLAAAKFLLPFSLLSALGGWWGFPVRFAGDPPPASLMALTERITPWFSPGGSLEADHVRLLLLTVLSASAAAVMLAIFWRIHDAARRARIEEFRADVDPDDRAASIGFMRAALLTACALTVIAVPVLGGALRGSAHAHQVLQANTRALSAARVTVRPARPGMGSRSVVNVDERGVSIRNITLRELTGMAYGVNRFFVRGKHFKHGEVEDWLVDSRHDVRIDGPVIEPEHFDTYALRFAITRELAKNFGLEIYVNSECQKPCGKWADRVLVEVAPGSWALVEAAQAPATVATPAPTLK